MFSKWKRVEGVLLLGVSALGVTEGASTLVGTGPSFPAVALLVLGLLLLGHAVRRVTRRTRRERVLILGSGRTARKLAAEIEARPELGWSVVSLCGTGEEPGGLSAIRAHNADRIVVALDERRGRLPVLPLLAEKARGVVVEEAAAVYERITGKIAVEWLRPSELLFGDGFRVPPLHQVLSRLMSVCAAVIGFVVAAPLFPIIALAIKLESTGPVFFRQARIGLGGRPFELVKFRTMRTARVGHSEWERDNLDRLTGLGRWLRRFRLDELPQLLNILNGDMNLVGPRPHPVSNFALFAQRIPYYELRTLVRPGLTGWAQVRYGYANSLEEETEKMRYDLYYLKHRSLWLDLRVLPATIRVALGGGGAAVAASPTRSMLTEPVIIQQPEQQR